MKAKTLVGARQFGLATSAALLVSLGLGGTAAATPWNNTPHGHRPDAAPTLGSASVANDTLTITGTNGPDQITIALANGDPNTLDVDLDNNGSPDQSFDRGTFSAIAVFLRGGDDQFSETGSVFPDETLTVDAGSGDDTIATGGGNDLVLGGSGDDTITSGGGDDVIDAGSGSDVVTGGIGHDTAFLGSGHDSFVWNPGEGSDFVDGGSSTDTLVFIGSAGNEQMSLSANEHRSVFLRQPGNVRMDMDSIEQLDLTPLDGADTVAINDMTGTDFRQANIDLSLPTGGDAKADNVTVNGTDGADRVKVEADDGRIDVEGLKTETRITGSEPTDHLQVNTLDGRDKVRTDDGVLPLIGLGVDLGADQT